MNCASTLTSFAYLTFCKDINSDMENCDKCKSNAGIYVEAGVKKCSATAIPGCTKFDNEANLTAKTVCLNCADGLERYLGFCRDVDCHKDASKFSNVGLCLECKNADFNLGSNSIYCYDTKVNNCFDVAGPVDHNN